MALGIETLARPYAKAAFEFALGKQALDTWSVWLNQLAVAVSHPELNALIADPTITVAERARLLDDINQSLSNAPGTENFIRLLIKKHRLGLVPVITRLFDAMKQRQASECSVEVTAAWELTDRQKESLTESLSHRLKQTIMLHCKVDASLLGGLVVRLGDTVIDHSIRGHLNRLSTQFD